MITKLQALTTQREKLLKQLNKGFDGFIANDYLSINRKLEEIKTRWVYEYVK